MADNNVPDVWGCIINNMKFSGVSSYEYLRFSINVLGVVNRGFHILDADVDSMDDVGIPVPALATVPVNHFSLALDFIPASRYSRTFSIAAGVGNVLHPFHCHGQYGNQLHRVEPIERVGSTLNCRISAFMCCTGAHCRPYRLAGITHAHEPIARDDDDIIGDIDCPYILLGCGSTGTSDTVLSTPSGEVAHLIDAHSSIKPL